MSRSVVRPPASSLIRRGTLRAPGADLRKLPVAFDVGGINLAEGLRAAVASGAVLVLNIWVQSPALLFVAFAANLTCFCDVGGPLRDRVPALLSFTVLAAALWSGIGLLHGFGLPLLLPVTGVVVFCNAMGRVWGTRAQAVGNILTVVLALALDRSLAPAQAGTLFAAFIVGGAWAVLMTVGIWRIHPERPGSRMVAQNWHLLASFARDLGDVTQASGEARIAAFEAHARAHRRALRDAIEETRAALLATARPQGLAGTVMARNLLAIEDQDRIFGVLIALSDMLEDADDPGLTGAAAKMLRRLRPMLDLSGHPDVGRTRDIEPALDRLAATAVAHPTLADLVAVLIDRLRVADRLRAEGGETPRADAALASRWTLDTWLAPVRANLTWSSAILRHAVRAAVLTMAAVAISLTWWSVYSHWLTITVALTMQPYFAATWQRALERIGGTVLGALIGGTLAFFPQTPLVDSLLMVPLSVIGFSVRQVSYGAYVACLTPLVVILFDVAEPGHPEWLIATMRTLYTIGGGLVAVLACTVLWPSWEPDRTAESLRQALRAHARYAVAVLAALSGDANPTAGAAMNIAATMGRGDGVEAARRAAGVSSNNLEASLSRALQEPRRRHARRLETLMAADAALRRLGGALTALRHDSHARDGLTAEAWVAWCDWIPAALDGLASGAAGAPPPSAAPSSTLARIGRVIAVLGDIVKARWDDDGSVQTPAATVTSGLR